MRVGTFQPPVTHWPMDAAWASAAEVCAAAYRVSPEAILAPSRGRGPRPPADVWDAKKTAIYLTVVLSDCDYARVGRLIGLHKDTVSTHCAAVRNACADSADWEARVEGLALLAAHRLSSPAALVAPSANDLPRLVAVLREKIDLVALAARLERVEGHLGLSSDSQASSDGPKKSRSCDHKRVAA